MFLLDPGRGARRRARIRDMAVHGSNVTVRTIGKVGRDGWHRLYGAGASIRRAIQRTPVNDDVLVERVRSKLGRLVSHPHAIAVSAANGSVILKGPVLEREAEQLLRTVRRISGVRRLVDELDRHERPDSIAALQGGRARGDRPDVLQRRWPPATRAAVGAAGGALVVLARRYMNRPRRALKRSAAR
jgi:hypothetical protein